MMLKQPIGCLTSVSTDERTDNSVVVQGPRGPVCAEAACHKWPVYRVVGA